MVQPQEHRRVIRNLQARIDEQIDEVARVICEDRDAEQEVRLLTRLSSVLVSWKSMSKAASEPPVRPMSFYGDENANCAPIQPEQGKHYHV